MRRQSQRKEVQPCIQGGGSNREKLKGGKGFQGEGKPGQTIGRFRDMEGHGAGINLTRPDKKEN